MPIVALAGYTLVRALRHRKEPSTRGVPAAATNGNDGTASLKSGLSRRLAKTGDLHLLDAWDDLDDLEQEMLAKDIGASRPGFMKSSSDPLL